MTGASRFVGSLALLALSPTAAAAQSGGGSVFSDPLPLAIVLAGGLVLVGLLALVWSLARLSQSLDLGLRQGQDLVRTGQQDLHNGQEGIRLAVEHLTRQTSPALKTLEERLEGAVAAVYSVEQGTVAAVQAVEQATIVAGAKTGQHLQELLQAAALGRQHLEERATTLEQAILGKFRGDAVVLAETLIGDLQSIHDTLELHLVRLDEVLGERRDKGYTKTNPRDLLPLVISPTYAAVASRTGLLGSSLAGDVAWIFGRFEGWKQIEAVAATRANTVPLDHAFEMMELVEDTNDGLVHLIARLRAFLEGRMIPETAQSLVMRRAETRHDLEAEEDAERRNQEELELAEQAELAELESQSSSTVPPIDDVTLGSD